MRRTSMWFTLLLIVLFSSGCAVTDWGVSVFAGLSALTGLWFIFWPIIVLGFIFLSWILEDTNDNPILFSATLFGYFAVIQWSSKIDIFSFIKENTTTFFFYLLIYIIFGIAWAFYRLYIKGIKEKEKFLKRKKEFLSENNNNEDAWIKNLSGSFEYERPELKNKKNRIIKWITFWPFSVFWYFFHDLVKDFFNAIYNALKDLYEKVYLKAIGKEVLSDYEKAEQYKIKKGGYNF